MLIQDLQQFHSVNSKTSRAALKAFSEHTWFLTEEMVPLALFSDKLEDDQKQFLANKIMCTEPQPTFLNRHGSGFGKPNLPSIPHQETDLNLAQFAGTQSKTFFSLMKLDLNFLSIPSSLLASTPKYNSTKEVVDGIQVVNDAAERGVKLCYGYIGIAHNKE